METSEQLVIPHKGNATMPEGPFLFGSVGRGSIPFLTSLSTPDPRSKAIRHPG